MKKTKIGYMCGIAYQDELENTEVEVHPSKRSLQLNSKCCRPKGECGIAKVEVRFIRWIRKPRV